jgi:hypothetical protein
MRNLEQYVQQLNAYSQIFNKPVMYIDKLTPVQFQQLADGLENNLSPENLTCDGELRGAVLMKRARMLQGAKAELLKLAKLRGICIKEPSYW